MDKSTLRAREHVFFPILRTFGWTVALAILYSASLITVGVTWFQPGISTVKVLVNVSWYIFILPLLIGLPVTVVWLKWYRQGVFIDNGTLSLFFPTQYGLAIEEQKFGPKEARLETRSMPWPLSHFFARVAIDEKNTPEEFRVWTISPREARWLTENYEGRPNGKKEEPKGGNNKATTATEGADWVIRVLKMLLEARGDTQLLAAIAYFQGISNSSDAAMRQLVEKALAERVVLKYLKQ